MTTAGSKIPTFTIGGTAILGDTATAAAPAPVATAAAPAPAPAATAAAAAPAPVATAASTIHDFTIYAFKDGSPNSWTPVEGSAAVSGGKTDIPKDTWPCHMCRYCTPRDCNFFHIQNNTRFNLICNDCVNALSEIIISFYGNDAHTAMTTFNSKSRRY